MQEYLVCFQTRTGEYEFYHYELIRAHDREHLDQELNSYMYEHYDHAPYIEGRWWYYDAGCVGMRVVSVAEPDPFEADIIAKYITL